MSSIRAGVELARLQPLNERLQRDFIDSGRIPGCQWLLARRGEVLARQTLGRMDVERDRAMREDTLFRIYSMTKPITSLALMMLHEEGRFGLNDPVHTWLPEWREQRVWVQGRGAAMQTRPPRQPVTFRHLLNHSSGLTYGGGLLPAGVAPDAVDEAYRAADINTRNGDSLDTLVSKLARVPLRFDPGEAWCYSLATDVCGWLVQRLSGQRFEHFVTERICAPLGLHDTFFEVPPDKAERLAANYRFDAERHMALADDPATSPWLRTPALHSGGGGLVSSLADYHRLCEMLRRGGELDGVRLIGPRTLAMMRANHLPGDADLTQRAIDSFSETLHQGVGFGLGFATTLSEARAGVCGAGDFYWGGLASTLFWVDPREDLVAIFLTQLMPSRSYNFRGLLKSVIYGALVD
ncbi:MAG: beta-lactamase family protein [Rubrivivax sp.]|nr:beta-lactamase family protein [Rubrivivax sp.]